MDNIKLDGLLQDVRQRQFWLKPIGLPGLPLPMPIEEWPETEIEIVFTRETGGIADGDILIAFRTGVSKLIYVAERLPEAQWTKPEDAKTPEVKERYPHFFKTKNLTPEYGRAWSRFDRHPFRLAREYNALHPADPVVLGALQRGSDRLCIPRPFAEFLIRQILALPSS